LSGSDSGYSYNSAVVNKSGPVSGHLARVLVVEDEANLADTIAYNLRREGYDASTAGDGYAGLDAAHAQQPDVVVLDLMLPGIDGLELCRRLRRTSAVPIIMLTARGDEMDRVVGLEVGADDYLAKPFSMRELLARVRALLRRRDLIREEMGGALRDADVLTVGEVTLDVPAHRVTVRGEGISLTPKEFALLEAMLRHRGQVLGAGQLLEMIWGYTDTDTRTVAVHIRSLREKIEEDPSRPHHIETVRGVGYRYAA
jgi:DNA-binding response OmpR family regulator